MIVKLKKDIVIPAGTILHPSPIKTERHGEGHVSQSIGLSPDSSGELAYFIDDGQLKEDGQLVDWFELVE